MSNEALLYSLFSFQHYKDRRQYAWEKMHLGLEDGGGGEPKTLKSERS